MSRRTARRIPLLAWAYALALAGCADDDISADLGPFDGGGGDQDASAGPDASAGDAGLPPHFGLPADEADAPPTSGFETEGDDRTACYDGVDNDGNGAADCDETACRALRSCCLGAGSCCGAAPAPALPAEAAFAACEDDVATCLSAQDVAGTPFGDPPPVVGGGVLSPGGDEGFDSGVVLGAPVDLRTRRVDVRAELRAAAGCGASCLEGAGVALSTRETFDDGTTVRPLAGVVHRGSKGDVAFVVADAVVATAPFPADGVVRLVVEPTGAVRGYVGDGAASPIVEAQVAPAAGAHLVAYGRNRAPGDPDGAGIVHLAVDEHTCDMPDAWTDRRAITLMDPASGEPAELAGPVGGPALAYDGEGTAWLAFAEGRPGGSVIRWARRTGGGPATFELVDENDAPALAPEDVADAASLEDPELVWNPATERWVLLYTAVAGDGTTRIGRAEAGAGDAAFEADDAPVLEGADLGAAGVAKPTVARRGDGRWAVVVAVRSAGGANAWRVLRSSDDDGGRTLLPALEIPPLNPDLVPGGSAYDADAVDDPSLALHAGAWRLLYGRVRGARPSLGALASDELVHYRHVRAGADVLGPGASAFDALGAAAPDLAASGTRLELVYLGFDGVDYALGLARREVAEDGTFLD
ncbi:MAG: hypothetical protein ACODAU_00015 [Myxococcota bacterium]